MGARLENSQMPASQRTLVGCRLIFWLHWWLADERLDFYSCDFQPCGIIELQKNQIVRDGQSHVPVQEENRNDHTHYYPGYMTPEREFHRLAFGENYLYQIECLELVYLRCERFNFLSRSVRTCSYVAFELR